MQYYEDQSYPRTKPASSSVNGKTMTISTKLILTEAENLGISWQAISDSPIIELSYNDHIEHLIWQVPGNCTIVGYISCQNKMITKSFLQKSSISVARGYQILPSDPKEYWTQVFSDLSKPLVVKPAAGSQGAEVVVNIHEEQAFTKAVTKALSFTQEMEPSVLVEEMFDGKEYRVIATKEKVVAVTHRVPANVVGDGTQTIQELIDQKNTDSRRGDNFDIQPLKKIKIDDEVLACLQRQQLDIQTVPQAGVQVFLRQNSNLSTGGDSIDFTDKVHPSVKEICVRVMQSIPGLLWGGIDFMTKDITTLQTPDMYQIIEVNSSPGIFMHELPAEGQSRAVSKELLHILFPEI